MSGFPKHVFPVEHVRKYLEPGPVLLVSSFSKGETNIMTMGWHSILAFSPSLVGCIIASGNHSYQMIRDSGVCVLNLPTSALVDTVAKIGNVSGADVDKFAAFGLTPLPAGKVKAPLIGECHASFECRLHDDAPGRQIQLLHLRSGCRPRGAHARPSGNAALYGRRPVHVVRENDQPARAVHQGVLAGFAPDQAIDARKVLTFPEINDPGRAGHDDRQCRC